MRILKKIMLVINLMVIVMIFVLNYFYQSNGFDFDLKCICSGMFAMLGVINLIFALVTKQNCKRFYIAMALGLVLAMLGDVLIGYDFIIGAATFALGHVCFVIAYCFFERMKRVDYYISGILFLGSALFLTLFPLLEFEQSVFRIVCIVYALIISVMLGKAAGNLVIRPDLFTSLVAVASFLFFFSDLMLVFDWFIGLWNWTDHACMGTYYPALCILALSMVVKIIADDKTRRVS